ncbi:hypothetical protein OUZ56_001744 [Daphnia magna]|uniref:Uncharacterized protein n=1 Tax=Daphnia magna TaxID=35525 RepID=A0ABR0A3L5_9CRUS|nr:hypothetical protein OUZ56_001744 [Daphnia magna]
MSALLIEFKKKKTRIKIQQMLTTISTICTNEKHEYLMNFDVDLSAHTLEHLRSASKPLFFYPPPVET